jgi:hypothetical protein
MLAPWLSVLTTVARSPDPLDAAPGFKLGGGIGVGGTLGFAAATGDGLAAGESAGPASGDENGLGGGSSVGEAWAVVSVGTVGALSKPQAEPTTRLPARQSVLIPINSLLRRGIAVNVRSSPG